MRKILLMFLALLTVMVGNAAGRKINIMNLPPFERAVIIIKKFETLHHPKDYPYVGYGHRVLPGEPYRRGVQLSEKQADALLRKDLRKFVSLYKAYGKDALLLGVLAYNCGPGVVNKSTVLKKLKSGNRNIFKAYTAHCRYKGKFHKQLHQRRLIEIAVLYVF
ncbi:glycoside hydrolase family protein [Duncaniella freteri]|jgi:GH24 family phage-related lysozyme (muramidase)|uniref:Lysozyme n=1 Tax=Duncaniella freteri TaxID=2530391 RepID=A0A4Z0V915_9BACT|nr:glycoside hydrolase family protein [Duncaniella freteri]TGG40667.1 lysozyme [Duncaniella freteri]